MFDYRLYDPVPSTRPLQVFKLFQQIVDGIVVNKERALAEVHADYSTTTEIADALLQRADVPFRVGHHFASQLTDYGRSKGLKIHEIPHTEAARIYTADTNAPFPLDAAGFSEIISAEYMVYGRRGRGGPQLAEVTRMLDLERTKVAADRAHRAADDRHLVDADAALEKAFMALAGR